MAWEVVKITRNVTAPPTKPPSNTFRLSKSKSGQTTVCLPAYWKKDKRAQMLFDPENMQIAFKTGDTGNLKVYAAGKSARFMKITIPKNISALVNFTGTREFLPMHGVGEATGFYVINLQSINDPVAQAAE